MLPQLENDLTVDFEVEEQVTNTYRLNFTTKTISGFVDGLDAIRQAIFLILNTERFVYEIYSWDYGIEANGLIGEAIPFVYSKIQESVSEALMSDDRILSVGEFEFEKNKNRVIVSFVVETTLGSIQMDTEVKI